MIVMVFVTGGKIFFLQKVSQITKPGVKIVVHKGCSEDILHIV